MKEHLDKIPVCPIVVIEWLDHYGEPVWKDLGDYGIGMMTMRSVGFLIAEDKQYYRLAQTLNNQNEKDNALNVLKKAVISIKWLRGKRKEK